MQLTLHFLLFKNCTNSYALTSKSRIAKFFPRLSSGRFWKGRLENWAELQTYLRRDIRRSDWKPVGLPIRLKELRTFLCFPLSQHSGFYFPPPASKDRAVNSIEIKDFIILWTYSQWRQALVVIPPLSPERETCCMLPICKVFAFLPFTKEYSALRLQSLPDFTAPSRRLIFHTPFL